MFFSTINYINCILVFETYLAAFLFCHVYERREHFALRGILCTLCALVAGYFFPSYWISGDLAGLNVLYWCFMYLTLMCFTLPGILICYKVDLRSAMTIVVASYMVHHTNNMLKSNLMDLIAIALQGDTTSPIYVFLSCFMYFVVLILVYGLFFFVFQKQKKDPIQASFHSAQVFLMAFVVVVVTIVLSSGIRIYQYVDDIQMVSIFSTWQNFVSCLIIIILYFAILRHNHLESELEVEARLLEERKKQYDLSKENIESLNVKFHDLKYRLRMLTDREAGIQKEDLKDIYTDIGIYDSLAKTGNTPLDIVLTEYALRCENNSISFTSVADGKALDFMSQYDIYTLFGNAITNSIEAVMKLENPEKRQIGLVIKKKADILLITLENYFDAKPIRVDKENHILSSKKDEFNHGFGNRSMALIVNKYNGTMHREIKGDIYTLTIAFYLHKIKK